MAVERPNYAINPTPEQALRSNRAVLPARVIAALAVHGGSVKCQQCDKPAFSKVGTEEIPLCIDCWQKLVSITTAQNEMNERRMNFLMDHMDSLCGLPPMGPRFPPRKPVVRIEGATLNNIKIDRSTIGVLNTGSIETLDSSITSIREAGSPDLANAIETLSNAVGSATELTVGAKNEVLEVLSMLSSEATAPKEKQKPAAARMLLGRVGEAVKVSASLSTLWERVGPIILKAFE